MLAYRVGEKLRCVCGKILVARAMSDASALRASKNSHVGEEMDAHPEQPKTLKALCPRCQAQLRQRHVNDLTLDECPICCGLFAEASELKTLLEPQALEGKSLSASKASKPRKSVLASEEVRYLKCPICTQLMSRKNYGRVAGVMIDTCAKHGLWLDPGELERIRVWVSTGGLEEMQRYEQDLDKLRRDADHREAKRVQTLEMKRAIRREVWRGHLVIGSFMRLLS